MPIVRSIAGSVVRPLPAAITGGGGPPQAPIISSVTISGDTRVGDVLSSSISYTQAPRPGGTPSYQWQRNAVNISGATSDTYTLVAADAGTAITLVFSITNSEGSDGPVTSNTINADALAVPVITGVPTISGTPDVGEVLTATAASVSGNPPPSTTWQWERDGTPIGGATSNTYTVVLADENTAITVVQTETNTQGSDTAESAATTITAAPSISGVPTLSGTETVGSTLTATAASVTGTPTPTRTFQWQRSSDGSTGWADISGATSSTYELVSADEDNYVRAVQTETNTEGADTANSAASGQIAAAVSDAYIENALAPDTVVDFAGIKNSGTEYYRANGLDSSYASMFSAFSRAGNATMVDSDGNRKWASHSLATTTTNGLSTGWFNEGTTDSGTTLTANSGTSTSYNIRPFSAPTMLQGVAYKLRAKITPGTHDFVVLNLGGATNRGASIVCDLSSTGSVSQTWTGAASGVIVSSSVTDNGDGSFLCELIARDDDAALSSYRIGFAEAATGNTFAASGRVTWSAAGTETFDIEETNLQRWDLGGTVDNPDTASGYVPQTTAAAVYLARRGAYRRSGGAWINGGVRYETEARTNLDPNSDDLSAWTTSSTTIAKNQTGAGGQSNEAHLITATGANGTALEQITASSADHLWGCLMKRVTGTGTIEVTVDGGTTWVDVTSDIETGAFVQVSTGAGATVTNPEFGVRVGTSGDAVAVQCSQLEQTSKFISSPIPTNGSTATRVAESGLNIANSAYTLGTDLSIQAQGKLSRESGTNVDVVSWYEDSNDELVVRLSNASVNGRVKTAGTSSSSTATAVAAGHLVDFNVAVRLDGSTATQTASAGTAGTEVTSGVVAVPPLSDDDLSLFVGSLSSNLGSGFIEMVRIWDDADIAEAGIESATA